MGDVDIVARRFGSNTLVLLLSRGLNMVLAGVMGVILIRYLGRADYGVLTAGYAYISFFLILCTLGIDKIVSREVSRFPDNAETIISNALGLRYTLSAIAMVMVWAVMPLMKPDGRLVIIVALLSISLLTSPAPLYVIPYSTSLREAVPKVVFGIWSMALIALKLLIIWLGFRLEAFAAAEVLSGVATLVTSRWLSGRLGLKLHPTIDFVTWKAFAKEAIPVALTLVFIQLYLRIDQVMLYRLVGEAEVGLYGAAVRVAEFTNVVPIVFMASAFPLLSRLTGQEESRERKAWAISFRAMAWVSFPLAVWLWLQSPWIMTTLFGEDFVSAVDIMRVLGLSIPLVFANSVLYNSAFASRGQRSAAILALSAALANVILNVALIPAYGALGAAWSTLLSYAVVLPGACLFEETRPLGCVMFVTTLRPVIAALATFWLSSTLGWEIVPDLVVWAVVYPALLVVSGEWGREELNLARRAMGGSR